MTNALILIFGLMFWGALCILMWTSKSFDKGRELRNKRDRELSREQVRFFEDMH